ncbi:MAG: NTP transferase domain-containing protein [Arcobacteraceae bacterium]|nr:NTP transferase domain-containing protein [Arcobacteraceae bacterium]
MGQDKSLLPFGGYSSMIEYQYSRLKPYFKEIYISSKSNKFDFDANIIYDNHEIYSPMIALKSIFEYLENEEKVFIITVDTPLVSLESIETIISNSSNYDATIAKTTSKTHNLCGVFTHSLCTNISQLLTDDIHKINYLLKLSNVNYIIFDYDNEFININEHYEYKNLLSIYKLD